MARLARVCPTGISQHIVQRGHNKQDCFLCDQDKKDYLNWLLEYARKYHVRIHAWVLMSNHIHLLATPDQDGAVSAMMQSIGRKYVRHFNLKYQRSGSLWEGRFRSSLVECSSYILELYKYIEQNPVRANIVEHPADYLWSSYQVNALEDEHYVFMPHHKYLDLGYDEQDRINNYQDYLEYPLEQTSLTKIRQHIQKGHALGNKSFIDAIERQMNRRVSARKAGRPKRSIPNRLSNGQQLSQL